MSTLTLEVRTDDGRILERKSVQEGPLGLILQHADDLFAKHRMFFGEGWINVLDGQGVRNKFNAPF